MAWSPGTRFGPYEIESAIGLGGMGEVYKARDTRLGRVVALKLLRDPLASDPEFRERFQRDARTLSQLDHPHICPLYDVGDQSGTAFLVMPYLEGETLRARLRRGQLPLHESLGYAVQIADALDKAHRAGIVHRDLKPDNIFLTRAGRSCWISVWRRNAARASSAIRRSKRPPRPCRSRQAARSSGHYSTWRPSSSKANKPTAAQTSSRSALSSMK